MKIRNLSNNKNERFIRRAFPVSLEREDEEYFGIQNVDRMGLDIRVTSLERTLVDVLDRPGISGGWEEVWRSLEMVEYFNLDPGLRICYFAW